MSVTYTRTYSTNCPGDLFNAIEASVNITPVLEQIVDAAGPSMDFVFATALSAPEEAALDSILGSFVCPTYDAQIEDLTLNDAAVGTENLWSSSKINTELTTNVNHNNLLNKGTNTHAQIDSHIASTSNPHNVQDSQIPITSLGGSAMLNEFHTLVHSHGWLTGGEITDAGGSPNQYIDVAAGSGLIRSADTPTSPLYYVEWPALLGTLIPNGTTRYVIVNYNGGSPVVQITPTHIGDERNYIYLGEVHNIDGVLDIHVDPHPTGDMCNKLITWNKTVVGTVVVDGNFCTDPTPPSRKIVVSAGTFFDGHLLHYSVPTVDTSIAGTFTEYYRDGLGEWVRTPGKTEWDNTHYDDNSGTPALLADGQYASRWAVRGFNGVVAVLHGQAAHANITEATQELAPDLPEEFHEHGFFISHLVFQKNAATFEQNFSVRPSLKGGDHNELSNIGTNTHAQIDQFLDRIVEQDSSTLSSGAVTGGVITATYAGSPLMPTNTVNITAGTGYVNTGTEYIKVTWGNTSVNTVADGTNYICIDATGTPSASIAPCPANKISLGHVYVSGGNTMVLEVFASASHVDYFARRVHALVALYRTRIEGNGVHEKLSPNFLELDIDGGTIYSRLNEFPVSATSSFTKLFNTANFGWIPDTSNPNIVNTSHWNNMANPAASALVAMTPGYWKKDVLVRVPNGNVYYIFGQQEYQTYEQAQNGRVPYIPDEIKIDAAYLSYIVIQQGMTTVAEYLRDISPSTDRVFGYGVESHGGDTHSNGYAIIDHEHHIGGFTNSSSGLLVGGQVTVNGGDNSKFDLAAGSAVFVDNTTDPLKPSVSLVSWQAQTAGTITNLATQLATYLGIDSTGALIQSSTPYRYEQTREIVPLAVIAHPNHTSVGFVISAALAAFDPASRLSDLATAVGIINVSGNQYSANGANLNLNKTSGRSYVLGANFHVDKQSPDITQDPALTAPTWSTIYRSATGSPPTLDGGYVFGSTSSIDPNNYDDGTGTLAPVPAGNWVSIPVFYVPGLGVTGTRVQYPQRTFATEAEAIAASPDPDFVTATPLLNHATVRTYVVVQQGTTDLTTATFVQGGKFSGTVVGSGGGGGGGGGGAPTDASYIVTVADPTLTNEKVIGTDFFVSNAHVSPSAGIIESKLALNFPTHTNANDPTAGQKQALAGTSGTPSTTNRYVTNDDPRNTDARTPISHEIISNTGLGIYHTISGGTAGHVFKATGATTAQLTQLAHSELSGIGTNTHAQIDSHIASTSNPHQTNLDGLTDVVLTSPTPTQVLTYNGTNWINADSTGGGGTAETSYGELTFSGDLAVAYTLAVPRKFVDFSVGLESGGTTIVGSSASDRLTVGSTGGGLYQITAHMDAVSVTNVVLNFEVRVYKNGLPTNIVAECILDPVINVGVIPINITGLLELAPTEFIELFATCQNIGATIHHENVRLTAVRSDGAGPQGPQGIAGSGTTITLRDEGSLVANTPHSTLNFIGPNVAVSDAGGGLANITITQPATYVVKQQIFGTILSQTGTTTIPLDNTAPLSTEGTLMGQAPITPSSLASRIMLSFNLNVSALTKGAAVIVAVFRNTTCIGTSVVVPSPTGGGGAGDGASSVSMSLIDEPATLASVTYSGRIGVTSGTWILNLGPGSQTLGNTIQQGSQFQLCEIAPPT